MEQERNVELQFLTSLPKLNKLVVEISDVMGSVFGTNEVEP
jgi:hypothetical protein